ncbi:MAG: hypothetical protein LBS43_02525, partial [Prevotellaceae bacterium]|nr:hypothetical protein [Prevotellaceae bacterium]
LAYDSNIGVISNPNATTALLDRYDNTGIAPNGFHVNVTVGNYALRFSTGLTKPSIMECNANNAPVTLLDETEFCITATLQTTKVNVLLNDSDPENSTIFLTGAVFVNPADTLLATLTVNAADSTVSLTVKPNAYLGIAGHVFDVVYNVKDNGLPASQCATGSLRITAHPTPNYPDIRVHVCPDVGNVNLSKYLDTTNGVKTNDIQWTSQMPGISITSPAGTVSTSDFKSSVRIYTFTYTISSRCVADQKRKAYIEVLNDSRQLKHKDTVVICYKYAEAVQINQLFGVEAQGGYWNYPAVIDPAIVGPLYIKESSSGAVVMNGKEIYENVSSLTGNYHGLTNVKIVKITYKANNSCLLDPEYDVVIVLTENILN